MPVSVVESPADMTFFIAHDGQSICHYGVIWKGLFVGSGQKFFETFTDEQAFLVRLKTFKADADTPAFLAVLADEKAIVTEIKERIDPKVVTEKP